MKGDFSRFRYNPKKHYTRVLKQQGRVDLDSDWNEQSAILDSLDRRRATDVIGHSGFPKKGGGFRILVNSFISDVAFSESSHGWAVGNDANILFTQDGGSTWERLMPPENTGAHLRGVSFPQSGEGWAAGDDATILHIQQDEENGGFTVSRQENPLDSSIRFFGIHFPDGDSGKGWAVGDRSTILATSDGGTSWVSQHVPDGTDVHLKDVFFISGEKGWAVGGRSTILHTGDGGGTWTVQATPLTGKDCLRSVCFRSENEGWAVGDHGTILHTTDGGQTWVTQVSPETEINLNKIAIDSLGHLWIAGDRGKILFSDNEGADWSVKDPGTTKDLNAIVFDGNGLGCAAGAEGLIITRDAESTTWEATDLPDEFGISIIATNGDAYIEGLYCHLNRFTSYLNQPNYPNPPVIEKSDGQMDLVYLDVWERHITALEDPEIREVALGGPDTTTRVKTIFQVKVAPNVGDAECETDIDGWPPKPGNGRLTTSVVEGESPDDPCIIEPGGGYTGLENRFYRVEIHDTGDINNATFKWSRDNGSVAYAISSFEAGDPKKIKVSQMGRDHILSLKIGDRVEISGDETELKGNPGTFSRILEIKDEENIIVLEDDVSSHSHESHPKLRRWDQKSDVIPLSAGPIELEKGIQIEFSGNQFHSGEYWVFAARTATADIERLDNAPPMGIRHHYAKLALITWHEQSNGRWRADVKDCREEFPSLTEICAEDICFDNSTCELGDTETVQDAIDRLCQSNDLRHHNKHLHGWGIVCGLKVYCGPDDENGRNTVLVNEGYAIDCDGNDLLVKGSDEVRIMEMIKRKNLIDEGNNGEISLMLGLNEKNQVAYDVEIYDPAAEAKSWRGGELLNNIYSNCIEPVMKFFKEDIIAPDEERELVGMHQKRLTVLLNLLIQFVNPQYGDKVYISPQEDEILRKLYEELKELLTSKTFCAMFDSVHQFPEYPREIEALDVPTIFSKGFRHTRMRIDPKLQKAYTVGGPDSPAGSNMIHVFDLKTDKMVDELEFPGGEGTKVQDVAFSADGKQLYAVAILNDEDSIFAVADITGRTKKTYKWRPISTQCDLELVTLATAHKISGSVYAIGRGEGLFVIDPENFEKAVEATVGFDAIGHLVVDEQEGKAYATSRVDIDDPLQYNRVVGINLKDPAPVSEVYVLVDPKQDNLPLSGDDDIEIARTENGTRLCVVTNAIPNANNKNKNLLLFNTGSSSSGTINPDQILDLGEDTDMRLEFNPDTQLLMVTCEDSYRVRLVEISHNRTRLLDSYHFPVQIFPQSIAFHKVESGNRVYVFNWVSNTINAIPSDHLRPKNQFPLEALVDYRKDVFEAFADLFGIFLQYLKDCICDQLLLNCPDCDEEDRIYLASISIRDGEVYKVCNFSKRKYVKSFPAFDYWLSFIPLGHMIRTMIEKACCTVLPGFITQQATEDPTRKGLNLKGSQIKYGYASVNNLDIMGQFRERRDQFNVMQVLTKDWFGNVSKKEAMVPEKRVRNTSVVGKSVDDATRKLAKANITVERVEPYDPVNGPKNIVRFAKAPTRIKANSRVILYEEDGKVSYFAMADKVQPQQDDELRKAVASQESRLKKVKGLEDEVVNLRGQLNKLETAHKKALEEREKEIAEMKGSVELFKKNIKEVESLKRKFSQLKKPTNPRKPGRPKK